MNGESWEKVGKRSGWMPNYDPVNKGRYETAEGSWRVRDLIRASQSLPVYEMWVDMLIDINRNLETSEGFFKRLIDKPSAQFLKRVEHANREFPILVDPEGYIIDGSHRLAQAKFADEEVIRGKIMSPEDFPLMDKIAESYDIEDEVVTPNEALIRERSKMIERLRIYGLTEKEISCINIDEVIRRRMTMSVDAEGNKIKKSRNRS